MQFYLQLKNQKHNAYFNSTIWKNEDDYGNGIYLDIRKNGGDDFRYIDCRYMKNFDEEKVVKQVLQEYFGDNIISITKIEE